MQRALETLPLTIGMAVSKNGISGKHYKPPPQIYVISKVRLLRKSRAFFPNHKVLVVQGGQGLS